MNTPAIGAMRHRVLLERAERTADEGGAAIVTWLPVATLWAEITTSGGSEAFGDDRTQARRIIEVRLRHRDDLTAGMRFRFANRVLDITAVVDATGMRRWHTCRCEEEAP